MSWEAAGDRHYFLLESLWFDAVGKAAGLPAHRLMGGAVREVVPADFWANRPQAATLATLVQEAQERGAAWHQDEVRQHRGHGQGRAGGCADVAPDFRFTIDPMYAWRSMRESARYFEQLARLEQPVQIEDPSPSPSRTTGSALARLGR